ncbi:DUF6404 family protein [Streptomyces sp. NEAU-W12]|uniref:DUF6404 family protein n=1 Tax=Streptomyces sp. NEAU-W12 TaxID=2994668 RepID=UPI00224ABF63|nr:DUF6404 family protein [Streptomyces sp. NEAU-W12]MCX2926280.1 DUF6404 family protein [Streptomyces sp. NEAU-W12]
MAKWWRSLVDAFWALDRALGGQRRPTRFQKWVGRHPIKAGLCVALPPAIFFGLFFWLVSDEEEPNNLLLAVIGGLLMGLIFSLFTAASERLRQRRLKRLGIWDGS